MAAQFSPAGWRVVGILEDLINPSIKLALQSQEGTWHFVTPAQFAAGDYSISSECPVLRKALSRLAQEVQ